MRDNGGLSRAGESGGEKQTDSDVWRGRGRISKTWWMIGYGGRREKGAREGHVASELSDIASRFWIVAIQSALASLERTGIIMGHEPPKKVFGRKSGSGSKLSFRKKLPGEGSQETSEGCCLCRMETQVLPVLPVLPLSSHSFPGNQSLLVHLIGRL